MWGDSPKGNRIRLHSYLRGVVGRQAGANPPPQAWAKRRSSAVAEMAIDPNSNPRQRTSVCEQWRSSSGHRRTRPIACGFHPGDRDVIRRAVEMPGMGASPLAHTLAIAISHGPDAGSTPAWRCETVRGRLPPCRPALHGNAERRTFLPRYSRRIRPAQAKSNGLSARPTPAAGRRTLCF
jgi:hypothetical protein